MLCFSLADSQVTLLWPLPACGFQGCHCRCCLFVFILGLFGVVNGSVDEHNTQRRTTHNDDGRPDKQQRATYSNNGQHTMTTQHTMMVDELWKLPVLLRSTPIFLFPLNCHLHTSSTRANTSSTSSASTNTSTSPACPSSSSTSSQSPHHRSPQTSFATTHGGSTSRATAHGDGTRP